MIAASRSTVLKILNVQTIGLAKPEPRITSGIAANAMIAVYQNAERRRIREFRWRSGKCRAARQEHHSKMSRGM